MLVAMTQLELIGQQAQLEDVLVRLQRLRAVEVARAMDQPPARGHGDRPLDVDQLASRIDHLLDVTEDDSVAEVILDDAIAAGVDDGGHDGVEMAAGRHDDVVALVDALEAETGPQLARRDELRAELDSLPRTVESFEALLALVPDLGELTDDELAQIHLATIAVILDDGDGSVVAALQTELGAVLGARHLFVSAPAGDVVSCLIVLPSAEVARVEALLGRDRIAHLDVPGNFASRSLASAVATMRRRLTELPELIAHAHADAIAAVRPHVATLRLFRRELAARAERIEAAELAETGARTFVLRVWVPRSRIPAVRDALSGLTGPVVAAEVRSRDWLGAPPVLLRNWTLFRPFQRLVGFLSWPGPNALDPTGLMAVVMPLLFGIMVGDIGYGLLLVGAGVLIGRRWGPTSDVAVDLGRILSAGGWWSVVFGALFGELFGDAGRYLLGMPALWFYRGAPDALTPLLLFVIAVGAAHIVLGLLLGLWTAIRQRHRGHILERLGTLLVLGGLFAVAGVAVSVLPAGAITPAIAVIVVGLVLASVVHGALGVLLGPLELIGTLGNILSYLRLAAVGLASVYLAIVANELARQAPLVLGLVIAVFFHALNLALAAFSPMIQALRLHYVEFFGKFHEGGGREFAPLGAALTGPGAPAATAAGGDPPAAPRNPRSPTSAPARSTAAPLPVGGP